MTDATLRQALAYARHGWPVFPCLPGRKAPLTRHGFRDATTDQRRTRPLTLPGSDRIGTAGRCPGSPARPWTATPPSPR